MNVSYTLTGTATTSSESGSDAPSSLSDSSSKSPATSLTEIERKTEDQVVKEDARFCEKKQQFTKFNILALKL